MLRGLRLGISLLDMMKLGNEQSIVHMSKALQNHTQTELVGALKELVSKGLLGIQVEDGEPLLAKSCNNDELVICRKVNVRLFVQDKIDKLERENSKLREKISTLLEALEEENKSLEYRD